MERVYVFIVRNDVWIYILCVLGIFWYGSQYLQAQRILQRAVFGLERERGAQIRNTAVFFLFIFTGVLGLVYYVNAQILPTLPAELLKPPTPTPNIFATPLSSPTPLGTPDVQAPPPTPALAPTVTLPGQSEQVANPDTTGTTAEPPTPSGPTPTPFIDCTVTLNIREPANGSVVSGLINFTGTANTPNFGYYRLEANGPETAGAWSSLLGRTIDQPVQESFLGNVNLSAWADGPYLLRLTAVDASGSETGQCVIQVTLDNP